MRILIPTPQHYPWGSDTVIPEFLGTDPSGRPTAEMWFGAHPSAPSSTLDGPDLAEVLVSDPERELGRDVLTRFGPRLPYLLKLIAPVRPLSLQVHPNLDQAVAGHHQEERLGTALGQRNYPDANHKPEMVYALTTFEAVCGFRAPRRVAELLDGLDAPLARELAEILRDDLSAEGVRSTFARLLGSAGGQDVAGVARACRVRLEAGVSPSPRADALVGLLAQEHPGDPGVVAALLLNPVTLQPGEAMFVPPGCVHAYLSGFAVELMANSDNVLRAGLTAKHVDVTELLHTVECVAAPPIRIAPETVGCTEVFYAPVDDFELSVATLTGGAGEWLRGRGPRILLGLSGAITVSADGAERILRQGESLFLGAGESPVALSGAGRLVQAGVP
ncbi:mannose-6-phosphate isomerase, class I [Ruania halotolerans]|uniref:mannose-6-phosphate isomerase, class I n=1 Tax=Ruania halotolerans TaxID=2897773 RepID=UPI001E33FC6E|nr:mannose-6-phosphate isomerase, class I [Ruania halotolerans]UFU07556.1 mannose-6-phosphate isomerase, class I [Ruania halotolerans]